MSGIINNIEQATLLVIDDSRTNLEMIQAIVREKTQYNILVSESGQSVIDSLDNFYCDLILLDIIMPEINGYEVAKIIKQHDKFKNVPILFLTSLTKPHEIINGFKVGGVDYIIKPFIEEELLARIRTHLELKFIRDSLERREIHLENIVEKKSRQIHNMTLSLVVALESANLYNDEDTGNHIKRVCEYSYFFATKMKLHPTFCNRIKLYASLHDVGKIGMPDNILKKRGIYTPDEFEIMKKHVNIGASILDKTSIDPMAKNIALFHHERWDGSGYINGLSGEDIPIEARIVAIADSYDALGSERTYKPAFDESKIDELILLGRGTHFDPEIVDIYVNYKHELLEIKELLSNS